MRRKIAFNKGLGMVLTMVLLSTMSAQAQFRSGADDARPSWRPVASERLVKLPAAYLKKAIDRDFAASDLGAALTKNRESADLKAGTLDDLARAQEAAEGDLRLDLRQQLLGEKQAFIRIMGERQALERKRVVARLHLLNALIRKIDQANQDGAQAQDTIRAGQAEARKRFESSLATVDNALFRSGMAPNSRYAKEHARNVAAIDRLRQAISAHPMSRSSDPVLQDMSKREYLSHMMIEAEANLAVLAQEEQVLGFMAKLVALDAMAFAEELEDAEPVAGSTLHAKAVDLSTAVQLFIRN